MAEVGEKGCVVVTGASGFIGSWLVKRLLQFGYPVRATFRDPTNESKTNPLLSLAENRDGRLTLWKADLCDEGSFDAAVYGSVAVFHTATVMDINTKDPENEVIKPTVKGVLNVMRSCKKTDTVKRVVFTSSAAALSVKPDRPAVIDESSWSDVDFINRVKMIGWMYFLSKVLAERAAFDYARESGIHLISVVPPLVIGPFCTNNLPPSMRIALSPITGHASFYNILNPTQLVHVDDLCGAEIFLLEHLEAEGRYICSSHHLTIYELADTIRNHLPEYGGKIPTKFEGIDVGSERVCFSSEKLKSLGFEFEHSVEEMYDGAIRSCKEKNVGACPSCIQELHVAQATPQNFVVHWNACCLLCFIVSLEQFLVLSTQTVEGC